MNDRARYYAGFSAKIGGIMLASELRKIAIAAKDAKDKADAEGQVNALFELMNREAKNGSFYTRTATQNCNSYAVAILEGKGYQVDVDVENNLVVISWE